MTYKNHFFRACFFQVFFVVMYVSLVFKLFDRIDPDLAALLKSRLVIAPPLYVMVIFGAVMIFRLFQLTHCYLLSKELDESVTSSLKSALTDRIGAASSTMTFAVTVLWLLGIIGHHDLNSKVSFMVEWMDASVYLFVAVVPMIHYVLTLNEFNRFRELKKDFSSNPQ